MAEFHPIISLLYQDLRNRGATPRLEQDAGCPLDREHDALKTMIDRCMTVTTVESFVSSSQGI